MKSAIIFSTLLGVGYFPKIPGTAGTIVAVSLYSLMPSTWFEIFPVNVIYFLVIAFFSLISVPLISVAEKTLGKDNGRIVMDEFCGYLIAVAFLPKKISVLILSFILFRIFDILKPEPINSLQKLPRGWGVIADDVMAGVYTNLSVRFFIMISLIS